MKLTVLVDNNTYIDAYYLGEPAVSYYLEDEDEKILFDTGYSDVFIQNAKKMGIDLTQIQTIAFSHGHNDHTRGFRYLTETIDTKKVKVYAHPYCFFPKKYDGEEIGSPYSTEEMNQMSTLQLTKEPVKLSQHITFLGEIPRKKEFEICQPIGMVRQNQSWTPDFMLDDSALVYEGEKGLFIITGCSHSGICNIISYAKKVCHEDKICGVIGGLHLFHLDHQLEQTIQYFKKEKIKQLYPCHCVSFHAKALIQQQIPVTEVGVGLHLVI